MNLSKLVERSTLFSARQWNKQANIRAAFEAYEEGNNLSASDFDLDALVQRHDEIINAFPVEVFSSMQTSVVNDTSCVFVVGMLRSGSTLTEQIIDAHPEGQGLGELETLPRILHEEDWSSIDVEKLNTLANRYLNETSSKSNASIHVDKQLGNYQNVGHIKRLLPNAKIIHCTRNPMSMGLSCFSQKVTALHE